MATAHLPPRATAGPQVSGGFDEVLIVWDVRNARPVKIIPGHCDPVSGGAVARSSGR